MTLTLKINTVDKSSDVDWTSVQKTEGLTREADTLGFLIKKTPSKTVPALGSSVELFDGATLIFGGTITERNEYNIGGILLGYNFKCKDKTHDLDRQLVVKAYENQTAEYIVKDIISTFTTGITDTNVSTTTPTLGSVKFNYEQPSQCFKKIADIIGYDWYVDYTGDVHFFDSSLIPAPFEINDEDGKLEWQTLTFDRNIIELKNSIVVRGGEYKSTISEANVVDTYTADGTQRVFTNIYRYSNVQVKVAGVAKTVGIDNIDDPADYDCLYNFQEKAIKFPEASKPTAAQVVKVFGDAYIPLIAKVRDQISITAYGLSEHVEIDKTIVSISEAEALAKGLLDKWNEGSSEGYFKTTESGLLTGQTIKINSTIYGVNQSYKITRITGRTRSNSSIEYTVNFVSSGEYNFTDIMIDLISKGRRNVDINANEVLQRLELFDESIGATDSLGTPSKTTGPYLYGTAVIGFSTYS